MHIGFKVTERERERRQWQGAIVSASARLRMQTRRAQERNEQCTCRPELEQERARKLRYNSVNSSLIDRFEAVASLQSLAHLCLLATTATCSMLVS